MTGAKLKIFVEKVPCSVLDGNELWLCIVQVTKTIEQQNPDASNPDAVLLVEDLLRVGPSGAKLDSDCPKTEAALRLVVMPELVFGSEDRVRIDAAVTAYNRPLLLIAGIGFSEASKIRYEIPGFPANASADRLVNFGCAWLRIPSQNNLFKRVQYCKNHCEQSVELPVYDPVEGSEIAAIEFNDLVVYPVVCADLLQNSVPGRPTVLERIKTHSSSTAKLSIVAASLRQEVPWHDIWTAKTDLVVQSISGVLVLANVSGARRPPSFEFDLPRNLSGVYTAVASHTKTQPRSHCVVGRHGPAASAAILRDSMPMVAAGSLRLRDYVATDAHIWMPKWSRQFVAGSFIQCAKDCLYFELPRMKARFGHEIETGYKSLDHVFKRTSSISLLLSNQLIASILFGITKNSSIADPSISRETNAATEVGLRAVDALCASEKFFWPAGEPSTLTFKYEQGEETINVQTYTWRSSELAWWKMQEALRSYATASDPRPGIIVFAADKNNESIDDELNRRDITQPRPTKNGNLTNARASSNSVVCMPISKAVHLGQCVDAGQFSQRAIDLVQKLEKQLESLA